MREKFFLQLVVALACLVPIGGGLYGVVTGNGDINIDSHYRYLSGLLFAIGLAFATTIPNIEMHKRRFFLLTMIVFIGGMGRLYGIFVNGAPGNMILGGLAMELVVTPLLCWWQHRVARRHL